MRVDVVRLEVPALPEYLALVRMVVAGTARIDPLLDDDRVDDLRVIVSEACTNAIEATIEGRASEVEGTRAATVVVECRLREAEVQVEVADRAAGFDPATLDQLPSATDPARLGFERGLGIPLIRALSDEAEITSDADGTRVRITLRAAPAAPPTPFG